MLPKFRAWHKEKKVMFNVNRLNCLCPTISTNEIYDPAHIVVENWHSETGYHSYDSSDLELMQWTGLKDTEGNDIYEGDIVSSDADEGTLYEKVVRSSSGLYMLECIYSGEQMTDLESCIESIGVIGNIYEHGELLK